MAIGNGDFVEIEYTGKSIVSDRVFDTTSEEEAKKAEIFDERKKYGPALIVTGKKHVVLGLEEEVMKMNVGEEKTIELQPEKAFGKREQSLVRIMSINEFRKREIEPYPGLVVELDGRSALVRSVNSGRVMVDLNHPLAGERIEYKLKLVKKLESDEEKINGILKIRKMEGQAKISGEEVDVSVSNAKSNNAEYFIEKSTFIKSVFDLMPNVKKIKFNEEYSKESVGKEVVEEKAEESG